VGRGLASNNDPAHGSVYLNTALMLPALNKD